MGSNSPWPSTSLAVASSTVGFPSSPPGRSVSDMDDPIGEGAELLRPGRGDVEVVLDAQAAALGPVAARLDREHHALEDLGLDRLMGVGRLVRARADAVQDRVGP